MCGIFGIIARKNSNIDKGFIESSLIQLALLSESRGKDSAGLVVKNCKEREFEVIKGAIPISELVKSSVVKSNLENSIEYFFNSPNEGGFLSFGHARLVTNGTQLRDYNNQPVVKDGIIGVHNGIIVNVDSLWENHPSLTRKYDIDTEIMLSLIKEYLNKGDSSIEAYQKSIDKIFGTVATALCFDDRDDFILGTNNGSLYYLSDFESILFFASEKCMLQELNNKFKMSNYFSKIKLYHIKPNEGIYINTADFVFAQFNKFSGKLNDLIQRKNTKKYSVDITSVSANKNNRSVIVDVDKFIIDPTNKEKQKLLEYNIDRIKQLKRCTKCVLPETFPFIEYDEDGVCNYCNNYIQRNQHKPIEELKKIIEPYRRRNGEHDCLVPFSGGRDSTYVLHYVKNVLGLNPIAFTYDWGMVTDLARRNIARVCGKLGIENIIVAADINKKREYIRKNIEAWLKRPRLGMIPLFMAGDKYFFKYANQVRRQNNIRLQIWGINFLENTDFKVGFCGVKPEWNKQMIYSMNFKRQLKLFKFVAQNLLLNPYYFNSSIFDTIGSFISRYLNPREDYYHFFDFHQWNEREIEDILHEYDWETADDLDSTWRIGDGTASFYNYIYYTVAGFSEFDTFRSNQIREGMLSRDVALKKINGENRPRYESLRWYLEIIGLDFETVIKRVNQIPKLY